MDRVKLFEGELKLMELLWDNEGKTAKELAVLAAQSIGWNKNTTYTVIKKLIAKGAVERYEPGFVCRSHIRREQVGREQAKDVLRTYFGGSMTALFSSFMDESELSQKQAEELLRMIDGKKG